MPKDSPASGAAAQNEIIEADFCIIGAGSGGLMLAAAAAAYGQRVVLIEKHKMGGDGLNYGSVPSKALLAAAKRANAMRTASLFGIRGVEPLIDHCRARAHQKRDRANRAERLRRAFRRPRRTRDHFGCAVRRQVDGHRRRLSHSGAPLRHCDRVFAHHSVDPGPRRRSLFHERIDLRQCRSIPHLIVIGAGATGLELAQAYRRLGSRVTVLDAAHAIAEEDPELAVVLLTRLSNEGIVIREGVRITRVSGGQGRIALEIESRDGTETIEGSDLLLAAGRKANVADLGLEAAGIALANKAIKVNAGLRTRNRRVFAIGDAAGGPRYGHVATDHAGIVLRRTLFRLRPSTSGRAVPRVIFTDPELAHIGLSEPEARAKHGKINVLRWPFHENDRAQVERETDGHIKVVTSKKGHILGVSIVGARPERSFRCGRSQCPRALKSEP